MKKRGRPKKMITKTIVKDTTPDVTTTTLTIKDFMMGTISFIATCKDVSFETKCTLIKEMLK